MKDWIKYEDGEILIVNKPAGLSSQPDDTGSESVLDHFPFAYIISRLDKRVSGLMILAKNKDAAAKYSNLIRRNKIEKIYHCIVKEKPIPETGILSNWLKKGGNARIYSREVEGSKKAILEYKLKKSSEKYHLLEVRLGTGRFHQIRAQLSNIGSPILGDLRYGFKRNSPDGSIFLCCTAIKFDQIDVKIPLPELWNRFGFSI